jgi:hypothetical protein
MRHIIITLVAVTSLLSCGQNDTKQKELELKEKKLALKEKELQLKEKSITSDSSSSTSTSQNKNNTPSVAAKQDTAKALLPADTKILTLKSPTFYFGDVAHLTFRDFNTNKEEEYECDGKIPAINEIMDKCEGHEGCPALKGQAYSVTLKHRLMDVLEFNGESGAMEKTGKKQKRWVIIDAKKMAKP